MAVSYITDAFGKRTGVVIDIESWEAATRINPDAFHSLYVNTFSKEYLAEHGNINGEPLDLLGTDNFSIDGTEN